MPNTIVMTLRREDNNHKVFSIVCNLCGWRLWNKDKEVLLSAWGSHECKA